MSDSSKRWPGEREETFPDVFNIKAMPPQAADKKPGQLPEETIRQFFEKGYVVVESFFSKEDLQACRDAIDILVDDLANMLHRGGKIKNLHKDQDLFHRLTLLEQDFPGANILLHKLGRLPQAFRNLWSHPELLNVVEQLIGPDIMGHPVWNLRTKTPQNEATTVPWHQDSAYLDNASYEVLQVTAWIPLLHATRDNGCMEVVSGGHLKGKVATHTCCWGDTWYVMLGEQEMARTLDVDLDKDVVLCEVPYGGMLLINNMIPHRSLPNVSDEIRWSLDLRWQRPDKDVGFYGMKRGVLMRTRNSPHLAIDWDSFDSVDRAVQAKKTMGSLQTEEDQDQFETTIQGPWMKKWEMVHTNRHTDKLDEGKLTWHKS
ncbi:1-deoxypentalenic acid 11-beta-hydroxylase-like [Babylonia areolata]|uniref:1-deoxypentalenic acid 11-beta-hydroxylase-like n=1 Tax=Babylonia areolata TaxID=304850 RepID=UPI003FD367DB